MVAVLLPLLGACAWQPYPPLDAKEIRDANAAWDVNAIH